MRFSKKWKNTTHDKSKGKRLPIKEYVTWHQMMVRCYSETFKEKCKNYDECSVCDEWHDYDVFYDWFQEQFKPNCKFQLDKDLLFQGNKVYSPETCCFVPGHINSIITNSKALRGDYPVGVSLYKNSGKFSSSCNNGKKKQIHLGFYNTPEEAFEAYKAYKYQVVRRMAEESLKNGEIEQKVYEALLLWKIEGDL